jgi:hypothetical protein
MAWTGSVASLTGLVLWLGPQDVPNFLRRSEPFTEHDVLVSASYLTGRVSLLVGTLVANPNLNWAPGGFYLAGAGGIFPYVIERMWDPVREYAAPFPDGHLPRPLSRVLPVWAANQVYGHIVDLGVLTMMHGITYASLASTPSQDAGMHAYYRRYPTLLGGIMRDFAVSAVGNIALSVCALGATYVRPARAGTPRNRVPCQLLRVGARSATRAALAYLVSPAWEDWQATFWAGEYLYLPWDLGSSLIAHRWWLNWQDAYPAGDIAPWPYPAFPQQIAPILQGPPGGPPLGGAH